MWKCILPHVGLEPTPALFSSCIMITSFLAEDDENRHARLLSSKHMILGRIVSQLRKLKFPLIIKRTCRARQQVKHVVNLLLNYLLLPVVFVWFYWMTKQTDWYRPPTGAAGRVGLEPPLPSHFFPTMLFSPKPPPSHHTFVIPTKTYPHPPPLPSTTFKHTLWPLSY